MWNSRIHRFKPRIIVISNWTAKWAYLAGAPPAIFSPAVSPLLFNQTTTHLTAVHTSIHIFFYSQKADRLKNKNKKCIWFRARYVQLRNSRDAADGGKIIIRAQVDKLVISQVGFLAQRRLARGLKLNQVEATVCSCLCLPNYIARDLILITRPQALIANNIQEVLTESPPFFPLCVTYDRVAVNPRWRTQRQTSYASW